MKRGTTGSCADVSHGIGAISSSRMRDHHELKGFGGFDVGFEIFHKIKHIYKYILNGKG